MTTSSPKQPDVPLTEGEILAGKYRVEKVLGKGGMGVVVAAQHIHLRQRFAIKFLLPDATPEVVSRFLREARAAVRLKSEHVARVSDVGELEGGAPFMVMEYLEGNDLSQVLKKRGPLPIEDAVDYLLQACEAIAEAHQLGIVHRDLKPANLFLSKGADGSPVVKVLDFGISKDAGAEGAEEEMQLTRTRAVLGSPYYMAPEQMKSTRNVDARADIWSLGIILYQLLTKKVPYKADSFVGLCIMVVNEPPPPPTLHRPDLPPALEAAILHALEKKPDERYPNVAAFAAAIAPFGRAAALLSAERIARMQGAPMPSIERPTSNSIAPPPASVVTGSSSASVGSAASVGPSIPSAAQVTHTSPSVATPSVPPPASVITQPSAGTAAQAATGAAPGAITGNHPGAATGSGTGAAWSGSPTIQAKRTGTMIVGVGVALGALAVIAVFVAVRGRGEPPAAHAAAVTTVTADSVAGTAPGASGPGGAPRIEVSAGPSAAPLSPAPEASASASADAAGHAPPLRPGQRTGTAAAGRPTATPAVTPPPVAPPPVAPPPVAPPPVTQVAPPPAPPPPPVKKNPLDLDIK
jgi:serine/threonine-protein kinase